jgi:hypothetical protein
MKPPVAPAGTVTVSTAGAACTLRSAASMRRDSTVAPLLPQGWLPAGAAAASASVSAALPARSAEPAGAPGGARGASSAGSEVNGPCSQPPTPSSFFSKKTSSRPWLIAGFI